MQPPLTAESLADDLEQELFHNKTATTLAGLSFEDFAATRLKILNRNKRLVPFVLNPAQKHFMQHRTRQTILVKARQLGFSTCWQGYMMQAAMTSAASCFTLAHEDRTTKALRILWDRMYRNMPAQDRPERKYGNDVLSTYPGVNSEAWIGTAGNTNTGRGTQSITHCHLSEAAFYRDLESTLASVTEAGDPEILIESTANGQAGYFYTLVSEWLDGRRDYSVLFYPWWWEPSYTLPLAEGETLRYTDEEETLAARHKLTPGQIAWRRAKQSKLKHTFVQEYPETLLGAFLTSGTGVFGDFAHALYEQPEDAAPIEGHYYTAGLDFGQQSDFTALSIIDVTDNREVFLGRWRQLSWQTIRAHVLTACARWNVTTLYAEANSIGMPNIEALQNDAAARGIRLDILPFHMTNERKSVIVATLYNAIHENGLKLLSSDFGSSELRNFVSTQTPLGVWTYGGAGGSHDDTVICRGAACWAASRDLPWIPNYTPPVIPSTVTDIPAESSTTRSDDTIRTGRYTVFMPD